MYKRSPLEKRIRLRDYGVFSFWAYDHAGERYTGSTDVRHTCADGACKSEGKGKRRDWSKCPDWRAALEVAKRKERDRSVPPANPSAARAEGFTLQQALNLIAAHDLRTNASKNTIEFHVGRGRHLIQKFGPDYLCSNFADVGEGIAALNKYSDQRLADSPETTGIEESGHHTIQKEHRVLRHALALAKKEGRFLGDPAALVVAGFDTAVGEQGFYQPGEIWLEDAESIEALIEATSSNPDRHRIDRRDDILIYTNLGLRRREILLIRVEHIDFKARTVSIRKPKRQSRKVELAERAAARKHGRKAGLKTDSSKRTLPLNDVMMAVFKRRVRIVEPGQPLFTNWGSGNRDLNANWARAREARLERAQAQGGKRVRVELDARLPTSLTFNDLRRTFCSQMKNSGVSLDDCAELLGHEDDEMVKLVYGHSAMETLHKAVAKLPEMQLPPQALPRTKGPSRRQRQRFRKGAAAAAAAKQSVSKTVSGDSVSGSNA